jgi:hypothetical protein
MRVLFARRVLGAGILLMILGRSAAGADQGAVWITTAQCAAVASTRPHAPAQNSTSAPASRAAATDRPSIDPLANTWICFRKSIELPSVPPVAIVRIATDSRYWLWINDQLVVFDGQLKRGPNRTDTYCDSVNIAPHLRAGENQIAILTWYFGKEGFSHLSSGMPGLYVDGSIGDVPLKSDATWKAIINPAYGNTTKPLPNFRLPESNIHFDGRKDIGDWMANDFNDVKWPAAMALQAPPGGNWGKLIDRPTPLFRFSALRDYTNYKDLPHPGGEQTGDGSAIIARLPYDAQITPYLKIDSPPGLKIDIRTDSYTISGAHSVRSEYITRAGLQEFESLGWMSGHEVRYTIPAGVKVLTLKYRESGYDCDFAGSFHCDDEFYNTLWLKARRTLYVCMRDTYMDCPDRERAQWWGDEAVDLTQAAYALDRRSDALIAKGLRELAAWQKPDGVLFSPIPSGNWDKELPLQMLAAIDGAWTYYMNTADAQTIRTIYPAIKRYLGLWQIGADGLVIHRKGGWDWSDWGSNIDAPLLDNAWYVLALRAASQMAPAAGHADDAKEFDARISRINASFDKTFWAASEYRSPEYRAETDDRGNAMAVLAGLAPPQRYPALRKVLMHHFNASPYMEKYVLESLFVMNDPEDALSRMKKRYEKLLSDKYTTLSEQFDGSGSYNHAWSGGALTLLSQKVAGLAPDSPGWERYTISPQPGQLKNIDAIVPTPKGLLHVTITRDGLRIKVTIDSPHGTLGHLRLPADPAQIQSVWFDGTEMPGKHMTFLIGPGKSNFEVQMHPPKQTG